MPIARTYRFTLTVEVEPDHPAFDDAEWIADAAWGSLTNEYGLRCTYGDVVELPRSGTPTRAPNSNRHPDDG